jgi:UDP-glucose 4-epimerase
MKYVVTGGAGFIGNNIVRELIKNQHSVTVIDNLHSGRMENLQDIEELITFERIDIRDNEKIKFVLKDVDGVFHEAALTSVPESYLKKDEYFDVNVKGTQNIFEIANKENVKVVYASSSSVYGDTKVFPIKETSDKNPLNPYGETKLKDEEIAEKFVTRGLRVLGLRYFNVYGIGQTGTYAGVITQFLRKISENSPLIINGKGEQERDFIHVKDVAKANIKAMESKVDFGFFNIGTGKTVSINKLAELMINLSGKELDIIHGPPMQGDVFKSQSETSFTEKKINWKYEIELEEGLKSFF